MKIALTALAALLAVGIDIAAQPASAQPAKGNADDEAALLKNAEAFVAAFHKGDAKALAAAWTPDGDYVDQGGKHLKGRAAIEKGFQSFFAENKGLKLRINIESLRFVTPDLAIEDGLTEVLSPDGTPPSRARYTIVHVKKDGQWQLASVRDAPYSPPSNYDNLRDLEWLIGEWMDEAGKGGSARLSFNWTANQNFIVADYTTTIKNFSLGGGTQWIGWDPLARGVRSWTFDGNGSFGEATWARDSNKWIIKSHTVTRDGKRVTAMNIVTRMDAKTISWQSTQRSVDGSSLPDIPAVRMKRVE